MHRLLFLLTAVVLSFNVAWAYPPDHPLVTTHKEKAAKHQVKLSAVTQVLRSKDQSQWQQSEVDSYFAEVIWTVYNGLNAYAFEHENLPARLEDLVSAGYLSEWPSNPLHNWEPVRVVDASSEFSPGDLWLAICPVEEYSFSGTFDSYRLVPMSFELGIFGSTRETPYLAGGAQADNKWAPATPAGTLYQAGTFSSSARHVLEILEEAARSKGEHPAETGGSSK